MFTFLFLFSLAIGGLTFIAAKNDGPNQVEIKLILKSTYSNLISTIDNIKQLISLVFKDLIQTIVTKKEVSLEIERKIKVPQEVHKVEELAPKTIELNDYEPEEDIELKEFSSEVIEFIEQEENKAA